MHITNNKAWQRPGYVYNEHGVGYPEWSRPYIRWRHIDGPLLVFRDGQMHWLTVWERLRCWLYLDDAQSIETKRRPDLVS